MLKDKVQSLYNTPCDNKDFDITLSCCGSKFIYFTWEFYKGIIQGSYSETTTYGHFPIILL